jgi:hypothetical protein
MTFYGAHGDGEPGYGYIDPRRFYVCAAGTKTRVAGQPPDGFEHVRHAQAWVAEHDLHGRFQVVPGSLWRPG